MYTELYKKLFCLRQGKPQRAEGQRLARSAVTVIAAAGVLVACAETEKPAAGQIGYLEGFAGIVVADEPRAALMAKDVLSSGGGAVDAAVVLAHTLTVTLPSAAGFGGGGACVVYDRETDKAEYINFMPKPTPSGVAVPGFARGIYALHAKYGHLRWEGLLTPAERLARFGTEYSRALSMDVQSYGPGLPVAQSAPYFRNGQPLAVGDNFKNPAIAGMIGVMRSKGPGAFYKGSYAHRWMASLQDQGIAIDSSRVENYIPTWGQTDVSMYGYEEIHTVPRIGKGASFKAVWSAYKNAGADATAFRRLQATLAQNRPNLKGTTTFAIADVYGTGVSCALTMGQPFGDGAYLPEYGMSLSTNAALEDVDIQPVLMINPHVKELRAGGGASGGATGLAMAVAIARFGKTPDGMTVSGTADLLNTVGKTNLWACPKGIPPHPDSCRVAADAKGGGFGVVVGLNK